MDRLEKRIKSPEKALVIEETPDAAAEENGSEVDIISNLPNEILCHILSFLPTKHAVATTVLSTKWKNLLPLIPQLRLRLDDTLVLHPESASETCTISFVNFVDRLFNVTLCDVPSIYDLSLHCRKTQSGQNIANWVKAALHLNAKRMDLRMWHVENSKYLFQSLFGCQLVFLTLSVNLTDNIQEYRFYLPSLKVLFFQVMVFKAINVILSCCPVLRCAAIKNCYNYPGEKLQISHPYLKVLKIVNERYSLEPVVELDCPELEHLNCCGFLAKCYLGRNLKSLRIARFDLYQDATQPPLDSDQRVAELIKVCSYVKKLWLSEKFITTLHRLARPLPQLQNLLWLGVENMSSDGWELLPSLPEFAPNLKYLFLKRGFDEDSYESFKASLKDTWSICFSQSDKAFLVEIQRKEDDRSSSLHTSGEAVFPWFI